MLLNFRGTVFGISQSSLLRLLKPATLLYYHFRLGSSRPFFKKAHRIARWTFNLAFFRLHVNDLQALFGNFFIKIPKHRKRRFEILPVSGDQTLSVKIQLDIRSPSGAPEIK